jgi:lipopolysaccharide export system protein LptA
MPRPSVCLRPVVNSLAHAAVGLQFGLLIGLLAFGASTARADKSDREKPMNIEADRMLVDDAKKESVFEGHVVLTQGTLKLEGDRVNVRQDADGFQFGIAYGRPAKFRQRRDGTDEYIEGFADRLEYDGKNDMLQMFGVARLLKGTDEVRGDYISYNAKTEFFQVLGGGKSAATPANPDGRVRAVILPKSKTAPDAKPAPGTRLKPSDSLETRPK